MIFCIICLLMLTIICGEDEVEARLKFKNFTSKFKNEGNILLNVALNNLEDVLKDENGGVADLFGNTAIFLTEYLSKKYKGREKTTFKDKIVNIAKNNNVHLIDWEGGKSAYDLSSLKKISTTFLESKPTKNIFDLLDSCYPKNLKNFLEIFDKVAETQEEIFIYTLLWRHMKNVILAKLNYQALKLAPFQKVKIANLANKWDEKNLLNFYEKLLNIDISTKLSTNPYSYNNSVKLLVCYYLK